MSLLGSARQAGPSVLSTVSRSVTASRSVGRSVTRSVGIGPVQPWLPPGETLRARIFRHGLEPGVGVPWLDEPGVLDAQARLTYAPTLTGTAVLPTHLALRIENADGSVGDLVLRSQRTGRRGARSTMLTASEPYLVPAGQLISLGARPCGAETFELCCASGDGEWRGFADVRISPVSRDLTRLRPDPDGNVIPGLEATIPAPRSS